MLALPTANGYFYFNNLTGDQANPVFLSTFCAFFGNNSWQRLVKREREILIILNFVAEIKRLCLAAMW
ncbi:hypothetical protein RRG08_056200 [Elysia crispata]|uniref:Uncharacterized protein n=1 Tax=Elysia crispata TaxID=231223 RepID=A0AAE0YKV5_9GAST|nr:hypothetical protein RRG08_056200 [Elysia crispata]